MTGWKDNKIVTVSRREDGGYNVSFTVCRQHTGGVEAHSSWVADSLEQVKAHYPGFSWKEEDENS